MNDARATVYRLLEDKMLGYQDYQDVELDAKEDEAGSFVTMHTQSKVFIVDPIGNDLTDYTPGAIRVRRTTAAMLHLAGQQLKDIDRDLQLRVAYGYRPMEEQRRLFEEAKLELSTLYTGDELMAAAHRRIAVPEVAGHPTGGAVDVELLRAGTPVDLGTKLWDFGKDAFTFSPFVSKEAWANRQLLRRAMMTVGFAPFDGEWWHFSYGDKEWAKYYGRPAALYAPIDRDLLRSKLDDRV